MKKGLQQVLLVLVTLQGATALADPTVKLVPDNADFVAGKDYSLQLVMEGFPATEGGGVNLAFNPSMLQVTDIQVDGGTWGFVNDNGDIDNDSGQVSDIVFSDFSGVSGNATIATIQVRALKPGRSLLQLSASTLNPFASDGEALNVTLEDTHIKIKRR